MTYSESIHYDELRNKMREAKPEDKSEARIEFYSFIQFIQDKYPDNQVQVTMV